MKRTAVLFLLFILLLTGCTPAVSGGADSETQFITFSGSEAVTGATPVPEPVVSHLMVAGDAMNHIPIIRDAYVKETGSYDYTHMLTEPAEQLALADYAVANLETVLAGGPDYSGFPTFNSPDAFAYNLKKAGFDLLSTANNHSRDQGLKGIFRTLDILDSAGLAHVGTYRTQSERDASHGIYTADVGGISVAFLCYTYGLNGFRLPEDKMFAVNIYNLDYYTTICTPDYTKLKNDMAAARALNTDMIAVIVHWGIEYQDKESEHQRKLAEFFARQGADLVLGGHPHVLQPFDTLTSVREDGMEHKTFVCYSLGNFISNQQEAERKTTVILDLELTKNPASGVTKLTDVRYTPYFMLHKDTNPAGQRRYLINMHSAMTEFEAGNTSRISKSVYSQLESMLKHVHVILGEKADRPSA